MILALPALENDNARYSTMNEIYLELLPFVLSFPFCCRDWTRTNDLQVMSLASFQLLYSAIFINE